MSSQISWQCLSVENFFSLCNWKGQLLNSRNWQHQAQSVKTSWQRLSVQKFFSQCNWHSSPLESRNWQQVDPSSRLIQVKEFFQFIPWEGNPEIGSLPEATSILKIIPEAPEEITLTDLSELF